MGRLTSFSDDAYPKTLAIDGIGDPSFSLRTAHVMAWAAQLAYEATPTPPAGEATVLQHMARQWGWGEPVPLAPEILEDGSRRLAHGYVAQVGDVSVLAFCGTEPDRLADWRIDFNFMRNGDGVSRGVHAALDQVWATILQSLRATDGPLLICGHSLGAAFAVLAAQTLATSTDIATERLRAVYTFGMPRIGDIAFATLYNGTLGGRLGACTYRLVHGLDIVPKVPPAGTGTLQFRHVGRLLACASGAIFDGAPDPAAIEPTDGNIAATIRLLDSVFASWDRLVIELGQDMRTWLPDQIRALLPDFAIPPRARFPARYDDAAKSRFLLPAFRDHLMDCYLRALGTTFPDDRA